jgi:hypothetical protein
MTQFVIDQREKCTATITAVCAKHGINHDPNARYDGWVSKLNAVLAPDSDFDAPEVTALVAWSSLIADLERTETYGVALGERVD